MQSAAFEAADSYANLFPRFREAFDGLQWLLARTKDPIGLRQVRGQSTFWLYVQAGTKFGDAPDIWVVYQATVDEVIIYDVNAKSVDPDPEG